MTTSLPRETHSALPAAFASVMGWSFDLFDLFVLLYVAGPVGKKIFPVGSATFSLALVFASFSVSILMRPGGAAIFGQLADGGGRKKIMVTVMLGVGVATAAMGLVPDYAIIGVAAPIIFLILRVIQGLFVGGVTATSHTLGTESVSPRWRGLMSGMIGAGGAGLGGAMASVAYIVITHIFPGKEFTSVGWRWMFITGLLGAVLSAFVLRKVQESPMWEEAQADAAATGAAQPIARMRFGDLARGRYRTILLVNIAVAAGSGAQYYLTSGFLPTLLDSVMKVPTSTRGSLLLITSLVVIISACAAGEISEHLGRRRTMLIVGGGNLVCLPLLIWALVSVNPHSFWAVLLVAALLVFLANAAYAPLMIFLNERYSTALRSRGTAISWNTGFMLGGLLPTFVTLLSPTVPDITGRLIIFIIASVGVFVVAVYRSPETRGALDVTPNFAPSTSVEQPVG